MLKPRALSANVLIAGKLDLRQKALQILHPPQPLCYLRFSSNHRLKSCKSLCEVCKSDQQYRRLFSARKSRYAYLRVEFGCVLHGGSSIVRPSSVRIVPRLRPALYHTLQRNRKIYSLRHPHYVALFNTVDRNYIQLHKKSRR